jgi:hypothetical protein
MNEEDKKRFARYRPGYIESESDDEQHEKNKEKLGYIEKIEVNQEELVNGIINESKTKIIIKKK